MGKDDRRGIALEGSPHHLSRIDHGLGQGAPKELLGADQAIAAVEKQDREDFARTVLQAECQISPDLLGGVQDVAVVKVSGKASPAGFEGGLQAAPAGLADAGRLEQQRARCGKKPAERTETGQQRAGTRDGRRGRFAGAQEHGEQFGVGQADRAAGEQALERALRGQPGEGRHGELQCVHPVSTIGQT